jgi:hypothetical protein
MTDYELDSLSGALNFAYRLGDLRFYPAPSMEKHPAVPHYLLSWVGLALAGFPIASSGLEFFRSVLDHVERFHFVMIALSALAGAIGVTLFMRAASKIAPIGVTAVAMALWLVSTPYSLMSLLSLSVDCFGPMLTEWRMRLIHGQPLVVRFVCGTNSGLDCRDSYTISYSREELRFCEHIRKNGQPSDAASRCNSDPARGWLSVEGILYSYDRLGVVRLDSKFVGQLMLP